MFQHPVQYIATATGYIQMEDRQADDDHERVDRATLESDGCALLADMEDTGFVRVGTSSSDS